MASLIRPHENTHDFYPFKIGSLECVALCDGGAQYSLEAMVKNAPHVEVEAFLQTHNVAVDSIPTPYTYLHVNTGEHQILLDMGAGNLLPTTGRLLQNLKKAGLSPESIDTIFISHAHPDHVGGAIDDRGEPVFSNATYFIWERGTSSGQ